VPRRTVRLLAGPPVDLSPYQGKPLTRTVLHAATGAIMADITALLAKLRDEAPPAVPYDPAAARAARRAEQAGSGTAGPGPAGDRQGAAPA
jgi:hypothetical protein